MDAVVDNKSQNYYHFNKQQRKQLKKDLFQAYFDCRRNKRSTHNALKFEMNFEDKVDDLYQQVLSNTYEIGKSIAFIVSKPVLREIFAADFKDRVIHHYIINRLEPIFDRLFITDSYSCQKGKGTHFGVNRITKFIRSCSNNYKTDCYILKLDIQGFFMHIDKDILLKMIERIIEKQYRGFDKILLTNLVRKVVLYNPVDGCHIKGKSSDWDGLPANKSLFQTNGRVGLPIGNLTSQVFANLYLNGLDHFVKRVLKIKYYGRYVDDFVMIHSSKEYLKECHQAIDTYLQDEMKLSLHPKKVYLQHYTRGVLFAGVFIKPYCRYLGRRTAKHLKRSFYTEYRQCFEADDDDLQNLLTHWCASVNSMMGMAKHYQTHRFRAALVKNLKERVSPLVFFNHNSSILVFKPVYALV